MPPTAITAKYGGTITPPTSQSQGVASPYQPLLTKYGGTISSPAQPAQSNPVTDWLGIQNPDTYFTDALTQAGNAIMHPIDTFNNAFGSQGVVLNPKTGLLVTTIKNAYEANKTVAGDLTNNNPWYQKTADVLHSVGADAAVLFSPISAAFAAASQVPVLKEAADVLQMPFAVTGKIGDFAAESFIKALPIDQTSKDVLAPAFGEIGSLAGQILLGGKIIDMVAKGITPDKATMDAQVADTQAKIAVAEQHAKSPEMIATKYGGEITKPTEAPVDTSTLVDSIGKHDLRTAMTGLSDGGYSATQISDIMGKVIENNNTGRFTPKEISDVARTVVPESITKLPDSMVIKTTSGKPVEPSISAPKMPVEAPVSPETAPQGTQTIKTENIAPTTTETPKIAPSEGATQSGLAKSIEAKLVEQGTIDHANEVATYEGSTIKEQAKIFDQTSAKGIDEIRSIVRGEKSLPEGGKPLSFIVNTEAYLKAHPNADLAHELINSPLVSATSEGASNLGLGQNRVQDSFTAKAREIQKVWQEKNKSTPESKAKLRKQASADTSASKVNLGAEDLGKIEKFISDNLC